MPSPVNMGFILKNWFPLFFYSGIIFVISNLPGSVAHVPAGLSDKVVHGLEYSLLGFLWVRALDSTGFHKNHLDLAILAIGAAAFYGLTDEFHQSFICGRECSVYDWVADVVGSIFGAGV